MTSQLSSFAVVSSSACAILDFHIFCWAGTCSLVQEVFDEAMERLLPKWMDCQRNSMACGFLRSRCQPLYITS